MKANPSYKPRLFWLDELASANATEGHLPVPTTIQQQVLENRFLTENHSELKESTAGVSLLRLSPPSQTVLCT